MRNQTDEESDDKVILGVFLKGAGPADLWSQTPSLLGIGAVLSALAVVAFRK